MKDNFQLIVVVVCIALAIFGVLVFSGAIPLGGGDTEQGQGTVVLWGTFPASAMGTILEDFNNSHPSYSVAYQQKSKDTFDKELLEALASGSGPDMLFLSDDLAYHYSNKLFTIPYASFPLANFKATFVGAGEVFLKSDGIMAFPITIDPMVMYYNRSTLDANGVVYPPATWDDLATAVSSLVKKDESGKLTKAAVAMGHFVNVANAKEILTTLFFQVGAPIIREDGGRLSSALSGTTGDTGKAIEFYTDFADPSKSGYSWNRSFPSSTDAFTRGDLALYFGSASELAGLRARNPNLNFLAAPMPQVKGGNFKATKARVIGVAISRSSPNFNTAFIAANAIATSDFAGKLARALSIAPARRDMLSIRPTDAYNPVFYSSALYARSFIDPSSKDTETIFRSMVESVLSGSMTANDAIRDAEAKMDLLLLAR